MAEARRLIVNPADPDQRYILWSNGVISVPPESTAVPVPQAPAVFGETIYPNSPTFFDAAPNEPAQSLVITDWAGPGGYMQDVWGYVYAFGTATEVTEQPFNYLFSGFVYGFYRDLVMDPAANGHGYALQLNGDVIAFGTGTPAISHTNFLDVENIFALRLQMDWATKKYWVIDSRGRVFGLNGGNDVAKTQPGGYPYHSVDTTYPALTPDILSDPRRSLAFYDVSTADPLGWGSGWEGFVDTWGAAEIARGFPYTPGSNVWTDLAIIDDGTGANPLRLSMLRNNGTQFEWLSSTEPVATIFGPTGTITTSTRPFLDWTYTDAENDGQAEWWVRVFTDAVKVGGGFDPETSTAIFEDSGTGLNERRTRVDFDLVNGDYWTYVRVRDTSGLYSAWGFEDFTIDTVPPAVPTIVATAGVGVAGVTLDVNVNPSGLDADARLAIEYSDDNGLTWEMVRIGLTGEGAYDLEPDVLGDVTVVDTEAHLGLERLYRAICYIYDPINGDWLSGAWSATDNATLGPQTIWIVSNIYDSTMDVVVRADEFSFTEPIRSGTFWPSGRYGPVVVTDGVPKAPSAPMTLWALTKAHREALEDLLRSDSTLMLRDLFGRGWYFRVVEEIEWSVLRAGPVSGETTSIGDRHVVDFTAQAVDRPSAFPADGPLAV